MLHKVKIQNDGWNQDRGKKEDGLDKSRFTAQCSQHQFSICGGLFYALKAKK